MKLEQIFKELGLQDLNPGGMGRKIFPTNEGSSFLSYSPIDDSKIGAITPVTEKEYEQIIAEQSEGFRKWRAVPAPERGQLVREVGNKLREKKEPLSHLITLEMGKILAEARGEVQEAIDIADFAVGLSRQLYGKTMHSERVSHRMYEQWHPLGIVGVITAFNFPVAVWAWNSMIAAVCGDMVLWKPSEITPLTAVALNGICREVAEEHGFPELFSLAIDSDGVIGKKIAADRRIPLVSATGSCRMGRSVASVVGERLGRVLLELGGNNACIILEDADLELALRSVLFGAVGTAGQRCTTTRRVLIQKEVIDQFVDKLVESYSQISIGDPREAGVLMGPLINQASIDSFNNAIAKAKEQGGEILCGGELYTDGPGSLYVQPTVIKGSKDMEIIQEETFAPIVYIIPIDDVEEAIEIQNGVDQGLSSAIFTSGVKSSELFLSASGSDCGIANVNLGTSGAEIGGAFGGEKDTGGGREAGSDSWKQYMRRQTNTINYSDDLPLAQGIKFEL